MGPIASIFLFALAVKPPVKSRGKGTPPSTLLPRGSELIPVSKRDDEACEEILIFDATAMQEGDLVKTPKGTGRILKVMGPRLRVEFDDGKTTWVEVKDAQLVDNAVIAAPAPAPAAAAVAPAPAPAPAAAPSMPPPPPPPLAPPVPEMVSEAVGDPLEPYKGKCIVLFTSYASNQLFEVAWRKVETQLQAKGIDYVPVDGASPPMKEARSALWAVSGARTYPQVFIYGEQCTFVGGGDEVQELFDSGRHTQVFAGFLGQKNWEPCAP